MRKKILSFFLSAIVLLGATGVAFAIEPRASQNLSSYYVKLSAAGNKQMLVSVDISGVGVQDKIGVQKIEIEYKASDNGDWEYYDTLYASTHPEFYSYESRSYMEDIYFDGKVGYIYRVTLTVYAQKGSTSDSKSITSFSATCK